MDITDLFRCEVNERRKILKLTGEYSNETNIFHKSKQKCSFILKLKNLLEQITKLRDFLLDKRKSYMSLSPVNLIHGEMSEEDRDKLDSHAQYIIKTCTQLVSTYKKETYINSKENQEIENRRAILDLIEIYLKSVCKIYTEQKAVRVKLTVELQKMSKLTGDSNEPRGPDIFRGSKEQITSDVDDKSEANRILDSKRLSYSTFAAVNEVEDNNVLSDEELQMFERENEQLYNDLSSLGDEVKDIQSKVIKIAELQEIFTEKVMEQNDDIERISTTLVGTTENVKDANVQIREAIQNNASLRIYLLFFLLVMSFSLLFLDWYNE